MSNSKYPKEFDRVVVVECCNCSYKGKARAFKQAGGIFYENEKRYHITADCPKCKKNLINYHITR